MPFMKGRAPVRRTLQYLTKDVIKFKPEIKVMTIHYNINQKASAGTYDFQFWHLPQIKYNNPGLQVIKFKNMTPTPFLQLLFLKGEKLVIDTYGRSREEIHRHLSETFCLSKEDEKYQVSQTDKKVWSPAAFGYGCRHWCICEIPGQVPCPCYTALPKHMRGKYKFKPKDD